MGGVWQVGIPMKFERSRSLQQRFHSVIPGGSHTYAKGDDQFPESCPPYIVRGAGCHVWDADDNEYIEYGMGLRSVNLGHAYPSVVEAAYRQMLKGANFVRPCPLELECAEQLLDLLNGAEMVKFCKNGSDANNAALRLARAYTGRDLVAICADHPFFSVDDWFIGSTPMSAGIPASVQRSTVKFRYNDLPSVQRLFDEYPGKIACFILEPEKEVEPAAHFLQELQALCHRHGAVFVLDEMITGFRWDNGGGQTFHRIVPDLSTFGKALGNGFSVSALAGKREIMRLGGADHDRERVFLLSTTHGAETHSLAAAMETMRIYRHEPVIEFLWRQGSRLADGVRAVSKKLGLANHFLLLGRPCCLVYATLDNNGKPSQSLRTLFLQETIKRNLLIPSMVVSYSHGNEEIDRTIEAIADALVVYQKALDEGVDKYLIGRPVKPVFRKYN